MSNLAASSYERIVGTPAIIRLLVLINLIATSVIGGSIWILSGWMKITLALLLTVLASLLIFLLQKAGYSQLAGFLLFLVVSSMITYIVGIEDGIYDEGMMVYPLLIVFTGLMFGKRSTVLVTGISINQIFLIHILAEAGIVQPFEGAVQMTYRDTMTSVIIILVSGYIIWLVIDIIESSVTQILQSEQNVEQAYNQTLIAWAKALEIRQREAPGHSAGVSSLASLLAEYIGLTPGQVKGVWQGALLHDIGKMGIPESVLLKPEAHTVEERLLIQTHTRLGEELIQGIDYLERARHIVASHHEYFDGQGYPEGLQGKQIPYPAQLFAVVDCWDTLRRERPCREAWTAEKTRAYLRSQSGKKFNPEIVEQFMDLLEEFDSLE